MHSLLTLKWDSAGRSWIHCSAAWGDLGQVVLSRFSAGVKLALCHQSQFKQFEAPVLQPSVSLSQQRCQLLHSSASMMPWKRATQRYRKGQAVQCTQHTSLLHYVSFTLRRKKGPVVFLKNNLIFEALQTKPPVVLFYSLLYIRWCTTLKDFYFSIQQLFFFFIFLLSSFIIITKSSWNSLLTCLSSPWAHHRVPLLHRNAKYLTQPCRKAVLHDFMGYLALCFSSQEAPESGKLWKTW